MADPGVKEKQPWEHSTSYPCCFQKSSPHVPTPSLHPFQENSDTHTLREAFHLVPFTKATPRPKQGLGSLMMLLILSIHKAEASFKEIATLGAPWWSSG